jgi:hypothetical protein
VWNIQELRQLALEVRQILLQDEGSSPSDIAADGNEFILF